MSNDFGIFGDSRALGTVTIPRIFPKATTETITIPRVFPKTTTSSKIDLSSLKSMFKRPGTVMATPGTLPVVEVDESGSPLGGMGIYLVGGAAALVVTYLLLKKKSVKENRRRRRAAGKRRAKTGRRRRARGRRRTCR